MKVTGEELRAAIADGGMTPNQFVTIVMDERSKGVSGNDRDRARKSAERLAKRWLSEKQSQRQLKMLTGNRALVAKVLGLPPSALTPSPTSQVEDRLESLEAEADQLRALLRATLKTLRLEAVPGSAGADPIVRRIPRRRAATG